MAIPQRVLMPRGTAEDEIIATMPSSSADGTLAFAVSTAAHGPGIDLSSIHQLISHIRSRTLLERSDQLNQLARNVVQRREEQGQEDIDAWANALARRIIESEDR